MSNQVVFLREPLLSAFGDVKILIRLLYLYVKNLNDGGFVNLSTTPHPMTEAEMDNIQLFIDAAMDFISNGRVTAVVIQEGRNKYSVHFLGEEKIPGDINMITKAIEMIYKLVESDSRQVARETLEPAHVKMLENLLGLTRLDFSIKISQQQQVTLKLRSVSRKDHHFPTVHDWLMQKGQNPREGDIHHDPEADSGLETDEEL